MPTSKSMTSIVKLDEVHEILSDVESIKGRQDSVDTMLNNMKRENEALWREVAILRQKHLKQQQIVEKLLHFLVSIVRNQVVGVKRKSPLMIDASSSNNRKIIKTNKDSVCVASPGTSGPVISDITDLEENADLSPLITDADNQLILSTNLENFDSKFIKPFEETSLLVSNENDPNSILDFDLNDVQHSNENISTSQLLDDQICSGLNTPKIIIEDSVQDFSDKVPPNKIHEIGDISSVSTDLIIPNQSTSTTDAVKLQSEYLYLVLFFYFFIEFNYIFNFSTFNNHIDGIDEELNWLQDQLYGGNINVDPSTIFGVN